MDGLDELLAECEAEEKAKAQAKEARASKVSLSNGVAKTSPASQAPGPADSELVRKLTSRLSQLRLDLVDPSVREAIGVGLAQKPAEAWDYYVQRPELAEYTLGAELARMQYRVVPRDGGDAVCEAEALRALYAKDAQLRAAGQDRGPEILWRMANQSLFAQALEAVHLSVVVPHDGGGALCLAVATESAEFILDLVAGTLHGTCSLCFNTICSPAGDRLALARMVLAVDVEVVNGKCLKFAQGVEAIMPEVVFDEALVVAAHALAELGPGEEEPPSPEETSTFASVRAASALGAATSVFGAAASALAEHGRGSVGAATTSALSAAASASAALGVATRDAAANASAALGATAGGEPKAQAGQGGADIFDDFFDSLEDSGNPQARTGAASASDGAGQSQEQQGIQGLFDRLSDNSKVGNNVQNRSSEPQVDVSAKSNGLGEPGFGALFDRLAVKESGPVKPSNDGSAVGESQQGQPAKISSLFDRLS